MHFKVSACRALLHVIVVIFWFSRVSLDVACEVIKPDSNVIKKVNVTSPAPVNQSMNSTPGSPKLNLSKVAEGGVITPDSPVKDTTHQSREHAYVNHMLKVKHGLNNDTSNKTDNNKINVNTTDKVNNTALPAYAVPEKNDNTKSVPKKGVPEFSSAKINSTTSSTTTQKPKKKKPTITEHSDDLPYAPSNFDPKAKSNKTKGPPIPSLEYVTENQEKNQRKADYVVPIVVIILSVPLVAIVISVLYKRGAEWWQHRHYRRMDFLIEGMYNN